ncbi:DUF3300 domain-containing protein [Aliiglaciecola sp.]|nr:DUF3300 domain-containing protein [Aliiglaciecola sp.]
MQSKFKYALVYVCLLGLVVAMVLSLAQAQELEQIQSVEVVNNIENEKPDDEAKYLLNQAELDQMLAPIALYPDSVLSHVLVASTYPLEVIQAARWREDNQSLDSQDAIEAVEQKSWDPSVKALVPFHDLLQQITDDLNWLQELGDAFLINEEQVLASIQSLRQKAYTTGSLSNNQYIEVVEEQDDIVITPTTREVVYIPYYDTRVVYGNWWWHNHPPRYWHRPSHYSWHAGIYWGPRIHFRLSNFFGGFHWRNRHIVVNHHYPHRRYYFDDGVRRVTNHEYRRWSHNPQHRRGVRYSRHTPKAVYRQTNHADRKVARNAQTRHQVVRNERPAKVRRNNQVDRKGTIERTQQRLNKLNAHQNKTNVVKTQNQHRQTSQHSARHSVDKQARRQLSDAAQQKHRQTQARAQHQRQQRETVRLNKQRQSAASQTRSTKRTHQERHLNTSKQTKRQSAAPPRHKVTRSNTQRSVRRQNSGSQNRQGSNNQKKR